jgi:subtilisin family serine protease
MKYLVRGDPEHLGEVSSSLKSRGISVTPLDFNFVIVDIQPEQVAEIQALPYVISVSEEQLRAIRVSLPVDLKFSSFINLFLSNPITGPARAAHYAATVDTERQRIPTSVSRKMVGAEVADEDQITGKGVKVAVLDTGSFPDLIFQGLFPHGKSAVPGQPLMLDEVGHGTWCNTCIAGRPYHSRRGLLKGVAPGAEVRPFKVLGGGIGMGMSSWILRGLMDALNWGADIISMSLGGPEPDDYLTDPEDQSITAMTRLGKICCIAAGNSGPGPMTIGGPGDCPDALTVGAVDIQGNIASFSSRGPTKGGFTKPDVVAPGVDILSSSTGYIALMQVSDGPPQLAAISGTSMATPHCTAVVALALQYARSLGKTLTTERIKEAMELFGDQGGYKTNDRGWGLIHYSILRRYIQERM